MNKEQAIEELNKDISTHVGIVSPLGHMYLHKRKGITVYPFLSEALKKDEDIQSIYNTKYDIR